MSHCHACAITKLMMVPIRSIWGDFVAIESTQPASQAGGSLFGRAWRWWEKAGSVLAIFGLADLFRQFVEWAGIIHWLVSQYSTAKAWVFSWLPFQIPPELHDYIVLLITLFTVINVGFYQRTGRTYIGQLLWFYGFAIVMAPVMIVMMPVLPFSKRAREWLKAMKRKGQHDELFAADPVAKALTHVAAYSFVLAVVYGYAWVIARELGTDLLVGYHPVLVASAIWGVVAGGGLLAWRWILGTGAVFAAIVAINQVYVWWLAPLSGN
jgi:hypothetical protein